MKSAAAINKFLNKEGTNPAFPEMTYSRVSVAEIKEFKVSCTPEEWTLLGKQACDELGVEHEPV